MFKKLLVTALVMVSAVFAQNFKAGAHVAGSYGTAWGENTDFIEMGWGAGFNVGADVKVDLNKQFSIVGGVGLDYRRVLWDYGAFMKKMLTPFMTSEYGYSSKYEQMVNAIFGASVTYSFFYIDVPVVARFSPISNFFVDAGIDLGVNVNANATYKLMGAEKSKNIDDIKNTFDFGLVFGAGYSVTKRLDVNFRAVIGLTDMVDFYKDPTLQDNDDDDYYDDYYDDEEDGSDIPFEFKNLRFHLGVTYWFM